MHILRARSGFASWLGVMRYVNEAKPIAVHAAGLANLLKLLICLSLKIISKPVY
jgi:hypothetical protein